MAIRPQPPQSPNWSNDVLAMAAQAKGMPAHMLEQLATRIQRHSGRTKESCWRLIIQYGIKGRPDYRRWTDPEFETVREELVKASVEEVARKVNRTPKAIRNMLRRNHLSVREIRCDLFSVESLAAALHIRKAEVVSWIDRDWLQATIAARGKRKCYIITPEALKDFYKHHRADLIKSGLRNLALFEAYVEYCFVPKHTTGEQLLDVRRDKKERTSFATARSSTGEIEDGNDDDDQEDGESYRINVVELENTGRDSDGL